jgi:hypothetical protein
MPADVSFEAAPAPCWIDVQLPERTVMKKDLTKTGLKLHLHRETLLALEQSRLAEVAGGVTVAACPTNNHFRCTTGC